MIDKKMRAAKIKEKTSFSANIITRLKQNVYIPIGIMEHICHALECKVVDSFLRTNRNRVMPVLTGQTLNRVEELSWVKYFGLGCR